MGLDMYFIARRYLCSFPEDDPDAILEQKMKTFFPELPEHAKFKTADVEFGYWRKANAIHKWFVDNVQKGEDQCKEHYVPRESIKKLLSVVNRVLADRSLADTLLPAQSGFFFGNTSYDDWYFNNLEHTKTVMENALSENMKNWSFYYQSSW